MPLPIAHALIGASIVAATLPEASPARNWKPLLSAAALAACPDLDYFLKTDLHRGFTHSIAFALFVGLACLIIRGKRKIGLTIGYTAAVLSHGLLDYAVTKTLPGVELFWPISISRFKLGLIDYYQLTGVDPVFFLSRHVTSDLLKMAGIELLICLPLFLLVLSIKWSMGERRRRRRQHRT
jgi:membrane-bound metal-dependent hydrolase YbcI (DUF457 family)